MLADRAAFCLQQILTATSNLDRLIEDLLHYSRLDAETATPTDVDLARLVQGLLGDRRPMLLEQDVVVDVDLAVTHVSTWERGLFQVLSNLIDNALKYSRHAELGACGSRVASCRTAYWTSCRRRTHRAPA